MAGAALHYLDTANLVDYLWISTAKEHEAARTSSKANQRQVTAMLKNLPAKCSGATEGFMI
jgi:hypothetical protein